MCTSTYDNFDIKLSGTIAQFVTRLDCAYAVMFNYIVPGIVHLCVCVLEALGKPFAWSNMLLCIQAHHSSTPLGIKFRPDDIYCSPLTSQKEKATGLVLKVKRRRKKVICC